MVQIGQDFHALVQLQLQTAANGPAAGIGPVTPQPPGGAVPGVVPGDQLADLLNIMENRVESLAQSQVNTNKKIDQMLLLLQNRLN